MRILIILALVFGVISAANAVGPAKPVDTSTPDVLVMVMSMTAPYDQISIQYNTTVPVEQATADIMALARDTGWIVKNAETSTLASGPAGSVPTTSTNFRMLRIADYTEGALPIAPFVDAFKRFKHIQVNYILSSDFRFRGLGHFENQNVIMQMNQSGNSYIYKVRVKDPGFDHIIISLKPAPVASGGEKAAMSAGVRTMLIICVALIGAILAYFLTNFFTGRRAGSEKK